jgi:hypothetical protein
MRQMVAEFAYNGNLLAAISFGPLSGSAPASVDIGSPQPKSE